MSKERIDIDCITANIKFCGEAMKIIHKRQAKALLETGAKISVATAVNKLLLENCKQENK